MSSKEFLRKIYTDKKSRNPNYSIRAFARDLDIPSGRLTEIFNGKRSLTIKLGEKICEKLLLPAEERQFFLDVILQDKKQRKKILVGQEVPLELFQKIFSPDAYALLSLMETRQFRSDPEFIAKKIGLSAVEVTALTRGLTDAGYITTNSQGKLRPTYLSTHTPDEIPSQHVRNFHKKVLMHVVDKLDKTPIERRAVTTMTLAVDKAKLENAKKRIARFHQSLTKYLESGKKTDVYHLSIQLFPVTGVDEI